MHPAYAPTVLDGTRRLLSRLDRRRWSPTFGCFDREYWQYKTLLDFPRAVFQQGVLSLALLYHTPGTDNPFAGQAEVLHWLHGALDFWVRACNEDGSVNEWYVHERSFCATAFTVYAVSETLLVVGTSLEPSLQQRLLHGLHKSTAWLIAHRNPLIANQMAASLAAIHNMTRLTHAAVYKTARQQRQADVLAMQDEEGWFAEYHGADLGYSLLTVDLLAHVWHTTHDAALGEALDRLLRFIAYFVHPDGTIGGEYGSRATCHCFPYGLELLAAQGHDTAQWILAHLRQAMQHKRLPSPVTADDTYAAYFYLNSFCQAGLVARGNPTPTPPATPRNRVFPRAGLVVRENAAYYAVVSTTGVWRLYDHAGQVYGDSGYVAVTADGTRISSQHVAGEVSWDVQEHQPDTVTLRVHATCGYVDVRLPLVRHIVAFKAFTHWLLKSQTLARLFAVLVKQRKILHRRAAGVQVQRVWHFGTQQLVVEDTLTLTQPLRLQALYRDLAGTSVHSPSSQLWSSEALHAAVAPQPWDVATSAQQLTHTKQLYSQTLYTFSERYADA